MRPLHSVCCALLLVALSAPAPAFRAAHSSEAFLRAVYAPYVRGDYRFDPTGRDAEAVFDAAMIELFRMDQEASYGEAPYVDGDPLCDCQDFQPFTRLSVEAHSTGVGRATAVVRFRNGKADVVVRHSLRMTAAGWRVSDVSCAHRSSLAEGIRAYLRGRRQG